MTLQLDEKGTVYCRAYTSAQTGLSFADVSASFSAPVPLIRVNRDVTVHLTGLLEQTVYYVYCTAEDDELSYSSTRNTVSTPAITANNQAGVNLASK